MGLGTAWGPLLPKTCGLVLYQTTERLPVPRDNTVGF